MKKIFIKGLIVLLVFSWSSCKKSFELEPEDQLLDKDVFDQTDIDAQLFRTYTRGTYNALPNGFDRVNGDFLDAATDDAISSREGAGIELFVNGQLNAVNTPDNYWSAAYEGIRRCNIMLQNIDRIPASETIRNEYKGDARFIRLVFYFELLKRYGGVPVIGDKVFNLGDDINFARKSYQETVNYIIQECDIAKLFVKTNSEWGTANFGRASKEAVNALKCRVYLYAASPLFNGGGFETNPDKKLLTGYPTASAARWNNVIATAEEIIATTPAFNTIPTNGTFNTGTYRNLFIVRYNPDIIFSRFRDDGTTVENANAPVGYKIQNSRGRTSPTQNFVNAFPNADGSPYTGPTNSVAQYAGRDPRFYYVLFYNGSQWANRPVETFEGGKDKPNVPGTDQTRTGYYLQKFMGNFSTLGLNASYSNTPHHFPLFRYAEVLLNYAEALNEVGRTTDAINQIIIIRRRAGITPGINNRFGIVTGINQTDMRDLIHNERRIELAFEEHRFWDIRRWKDEAALKSVLTGVTINRDAANVLSFTPKNVTAMKFENKYYHLPIPFRELNRNSKLVQNEGW